MARSRLFAGLQPDVWLLSLGPALTGMGFIGMIQLLKVLYILRLGFGADFIGVMFATGAVTHGVGSLVAGAAGGRLGPRRSMLIGCAVNLAGLCLLPLTDFLPPPSRGAWILLFQVVSAFGWSLVTVNQVTGLVVFTGLAERRQAYAVKEAVAGFGMFVGALIAGLLPGIFVLLAGVSLDEPAPYRMGIVLSIGVAALGLWPVLKVRRTAAVAPPKLSIATLPPLTPLIVVAGCAFLNAGAAASCRAFGAAYLDQVFHMPASLIGLVTSVGTFLAILAALGSQGVARLLGGRQAMMAPSLIMGLSLLAMATIPIQGIGGLGLIVVIAVNGMWIPAYQVLQMEMAGAEWRSLIAGASSTAMSLGFGSVSLVGGRVVSAAGYQPLFAMAAMMALVSAAIMILWSREALLRVRRDAAV